MPSQRAPILTLTTDFGERDSYVAQMKGVITTIAPALPIVDLSHQLPAQDLAAAARFLDEALPHFPEGSVHVAVIDPGVGGRRRPMALHWRGHWLVGPDNGIFTRFLTGAAGEAIHLDRPEYWRRQPSTTFHGRDIFAPVGAWLATGVEAAALGSPLEDPVRLSAPGITRSGGTIHGEILHVDHFGNLISNIHATDLAGPERARETRYRITVADQCIDGPVSSYDARNPGVLLTLLGSSGYVEVSVNQGHADRVLGVGIGSKVEIEVLDGRDG